MPKNCPLGKLDSHACWGCFYEFGNSCIYHEMQEEAKERQELEDNPKEPERNMTFEEIIEELTTILNEVDARETSGNCFIFVKDSNATWKWLCDRGIELFNKLKSGDIKYE